MQILQVAGAGEDFVYQWPAEIKNYKYWIAYSVQDEEQELTARIGFGTHEVYGRERARVIVWIDGQPEVEFFGVDDYAVTGKIVTEIKLEGNQMCRYPDDPVPLVYGAFHVVGLPTVVTGPRVHNAWGVLVNIADHRAILHMAFVRKRQRGR
jgi:hypothetical protein